TGIPTPVLPTATPTPINTPTPVLAISKSASPDPVVAGGRLTYVITITNTQSIALTGVVVRDMVPEHTSFSSVSSRGGQWIMRSPGTGNRGEVSWEAVESLLPDQTAHLEMVVQVEEGWAGFLVNADYEATIEGVDEPVIGQPVTTHVVQPTPTVTPTPTLTAIPMPTDTPTPMPPTTTPTLTNTPTPDATATSTFVELSIDEPLFAGTTIVKGNGISGALSVIRDLDDPRIVATGSVSSESRYEIDLTSVLETCQLGGLETGHRIQAESEGQIYQAIVRPQTTGPVQVFLPYVGKNSSDGDHPHVPPRRP
ncbi:MAG: DUF11 domain-containing protein, partial [Anaerolineae bacterium]|nr:DUF11 domain-containing protein [Anaerolineae bacterium]